MAQLNPEKYDTLIRNLQAQQKEQDSRLGALEGRRLLALDRGIREDYGAPGEGQVLIEATSETPYYYSNGQWRPFGGGFTPTWAHAYASANNVADAGATYDFTFSDLYSNSASLYEAVDVTASRADWIQINEPGYYLASFGIYHNTSTFGTAANSFIMPAFELGGIRASIIQNFGEADHTGTHFNLASYILAGGEDAQALWFYLSFHYDPANPVSDLDGENPLKVGVSYALSGGAGTIQMSASMLLVRIAEAGYHDLSPA